MSTSAGTTPLCAHCGRPIIGTPMKMGNAGEPYHLECTLSPYAQVEERTKRLRAALREIERIDSYPHRCRDIARAALEANDD